METTLDIIAAMRLQEDSSYRTGDFLALALPHLLDVDAECRTKMAAWCLQVVDFCKLSRDSVEIAMNFLDRYLLFDSSALNSRVIFQLASMTCLYMAIKIHEPEAMDLLAISTLSRGTYSVNDVQAMELNILNALQWRVNPPTSTAFAHQLLNLLPDDLLASKQREAVSHITDMHLELAVADYDLITVKASTRAFCSLLNAVEIISLDPKAIEYIRVTMAHAIGVDWNDEALEGLSEYLFAAVAQREPSLVRAPHRGQPVKASQSQILHRRASFEVSPRSTVTIR